MYKIFNQMFLNLYLLLSLHKSPDSQEKRQARQQTTYKERKKRYNYFFFRAGMKYPMSIPGEELPYKQEKGCSSYLLGTPFILGTRFRRKSGFSIS